MKVLFFIFCWIIFVPYIQAQISWSPLSPMSSVYNQAQIIHYTSEGFQSHYKYKNEQYIFKHQMDYYNQDLVLQKDSTLDSSYNTNQRQYLGSFSFNNKLHTYFSVNNSDTQKDQLFVTNIDNNNPSSLLFEINYKDKSYNQKSYKISCSPNQKKCLFYHKMPSEKNDNAQLHLVVVDTNFQTLSDNTITFSQKSNSFDIEDINDIILDNNGVIYVLYKRFKHLEKKEEKKQGPQFVYSLIQVSNNTIIQQLDTLKILNPQDSATLISATLFLDNSTQTVHCIGTFKGGKNLYALFDYNINQNNPQNTIAIPYPQSFIDSNYVSPRLSQKNKKMGLNNYKIKQILPQQNGDKIVLAEQIYSYVYFDKTEGRQVTHRLNNIAVMRISADTIQWVQTLAKRQKAGGVGYTNIPFKLYSFYAYQKEKKIVVLYNDIEANLGINDETELKPMDCNTPKDGSLIACQIDLNEGTLLSKTSAYNFKLSECFFVPSSAVRTTNNDIYFIGFKPETQAQNNAQYRFGKILNRAF